MQVTSALFYLPFKDVSPALAHSIGPVRVEGGKETHWFWISRVGDSDLSRALQNSLEVAGLRTSAGRQPRYGLDVNLTELRQSLFGIEMHATASVTYTLRDEASGETVYETELETTGIATVPDSLATSERLRIANEKAMRASIEELLRRLYAWDGKRVVE